MRTCDLCVEETSGEVGTPYIDGWSFMVCRNHFNLYLCADAFENIGLWDWCRRIRMPVSESRVMGKTVFCDWIDSMAVGE